MKFFDEIKMAYESGATNQFFLTGNVHDLLPVRDTFLGLSDFLDDAFSGKIVIHYDLAGGVRVSKNEEEQAAKLYCREAPIKLGERYIDHHEWQRFKTESGVYSVLTLKRLRELISRVARDKSAPAIILVVENADMLFPDQETGRMNDVDRQRVLQLMYLLQDEEFASSAHMAIMITRVASGVHVRVRSHLRLKSVVVERPTSDVRRAYLEKLGTTPDESVVVATAGMTLVALKAIARDSIYKNRQLTRSEVTEHLDRLLQSELGDKISIVAPKHDMNDVIGNTELKKVLSRVGKYIQHPDPSISPVGILVSGPNGVGKTFILRAWAKSLDMTVIELKNLRSMYFGQTDRIFELLRSVLEPLGNVMIIVDEADVAFAPPGRDTHATEARLFGNVIKMMGDPANRGKIIWLLMTARPQLLAPDIKRPGRCGLHLPIFDPEGEDRDAFIEFAIGKYLKEDALELAKKKTTEYSPSDFQELRTMLKGEKAIDPDATPDQLLSVIDSYRPANIGQQRHEQTAHAIEHCSYNELLPKTS